MSDSEYCSIPSVSPISFTPPNLVNIDSDSDWGSPAYYSPPFVPPTLVSPLPSSPYISEFPLIPLDGEIPPDRQFDHLWNKYAHYREKPLFPEKDHHLDKLFNNLFKQLPQK